MTLRDVPLFEEEPDPRKLARRTDPEESKKAAREIVGRLAECQENALWYVRMRPDSTAMELAAGFDMSDSRRIGRRLPELAARGKVFKSGSRPCRITGKTAATWRVTEP
jgi:predicted HTH transcriptional regulator